MEEGDYYTFNLPALKAAVKSGSNVNVTAALIAFLEHFDNGDGIAAVEGEFFVSDGEKLKEVSLEASDVTGKINR
jgi:predicted RNA-binding protein with TRAM domain